MSRKINLVSVIIPCYNDGKFIHGAIKCILNQTYQNFEIIVVDDGSDELNTIHILEELNHQRTTVYRKENGGPASARNYGIERSKGNYILTLDADDKFAPEFLKKSVHILDTKPEIGMVTSYLYRISNNGKTKKEYKGGDVSNFIIRNEANASLLFRYECWENAGGYDEDIPGFEDWEYNINVTKQGWMVYSIPEHLFYYRNRENSQYDRDMCKRPEIIKYLIEKHESVFRDNVKEVLYSRELELQAQLNKVSTYKNSYSQMLGNAILKPMKVLKNLFFSSKENSSSIENYHRFPTT